MEWGLRWGDMLVFNNKSYRTVYSLNCMHVNLSSKGKQN